MPISSRFGNAISFCISSTDRRSRRRLDFCHTAPNDSGDAEGFDIMELIFSVTTYPSSLSLDCWWYTQIVVLECPWLRSTRVSFRAETSFWRFFLAIWFLQHQEYFIQHDIKALYQKSNGICPWRNVVIVVISYLSERSFFVA